MTNNKWPLKWLLLFFMLVTLCANVLAAPPQTISYQAYLKDSDGLPVNATEEVTFRLYDTDVEGKPLWSDTLSITITDGLFSVELGTVANPLPKSSMNDPIWLGVEINSDGEAVPRKAFNSINNAFRAEDSDLVDGLQASEIIDAGRKNIVLNKIIVAKSGGDYLTIQAAINAVTPGETNRYIIEVAPGTYKESIVMKSYIHLQGSGPDQSIIIPDSAGANTEQGFTAIWLNNLQAVRISGFTLYGGESGVEDIGAIGIRDISSSPVVENMRITGFVHTGVTAISRAGIYSTNSSPHIYHNEINTNERYGVLLDSADSANIIGNTFLDNIGNQAGPHCAVTINESSALISNNYFRGNHAPVCVTGSPLDGEDDVLISSNHLIENYDGIRVNGDVRANIIGNYIETSFAGGIGIRGGDADNTTQIIGNTIYGTECGIVADGPSAIIGNYVFNAQIGCESIIYGGNSNGSYHRADTVFGNYAAHGYGGTGPHPGFSLVTDGYKISSQDPDGVSPGKDIILMVGGTQVIIGQDGNVTIVADGDLTLQGTNVSITATNDMSIYAGNALSVDSGSTTAITVGSDLGIITSNNTSITVGNTVSVESGVSTQISAGSEVDITGGTVVDINGGQIHLN